MASAMLPDEDVNWWKACKAYKIARDGLCNFVEASMTDFQTKNNMSDSTLKRYHRYRWLNMKNTDRNKWKTDVWEVAKVYMPPGYADKNQADQFDLNAICSVIINCDIFDTKTTDYDINNRQVDNKYTKLRTACNHIRHSPNQRTKDADLVQLFDLIRDALTDHIQLANNTDAQTAIQELTKLERTSRDDIVSQLHEFTRLKTEFKNELVQFYAGEHWTLPLAPLLDQQDSALLDFYVPPDIHHKNTNERRKVTDIKDMLINDKERTVFLQAIAGCGKTSFSKYVAVKWCQAHGYKDRNAGQDNDSLSKFMTDIGEYDFLLLVPLRNAQGLQCSLEDMIQTHVVSRLPQFKLYRDNWVLEFILRKEKCLILLEGLDEWVPPTECMLDHPSGLPHYTFRDNHTTIITTRPEKMSGVRKSQFSDTNTMEMTGLDSESQNKLIEHAVCCNNRIILNEFPEDITTEKRDATEFRTDLSKVKHRVAGIVHIPIILLQLLCLWFDRKSFGETVTEIYAYMLDVVIGRAEKRKTIQCVRAHSATELSSCFKNCHFCCYHLDNILKIGNIAFHKLVSKNKNTIMFRNSPQSDRKFGEGVSFAIKLGIVVKTRVPSLAYEEYVYTFIHKSYQEFLGAMFLSFANAEYPHIIEVVKTYAKNGHAILEMSNLHLFVSGMNCRASRDIFYEFGSRKDCHTSEIFEHVIACSNEAVGNRLSGCVFENGLFGIRVASTKEELKLTLEKFQSVSCISIDKAFRWFCGRNVKFTGGLRPSQVSLNKESNEIFTKIPHMVRQNTLQMSSLCLTESKSVMYFLLSWLNSDVGKVELNNCSLLSSKENGTSCSSAPLQPSHAYNTSIRLEDIKALVANKDIQWGKGLKMITIRDCEISHKIFMCAMLLLAHFPHSITCDVESCKITPDDEDAISLDNVSQLLDVGQRVVRESETRTMNIELRWVTLSSMMVRWMSLLLAHLPHKVMFVVRYCEITPEGEISLDNVSQLLDVGQHAVGERETRTMNVDLYGRTLSSMTARWMTLLLAHLPHKVMFNVSYCKITQEGEISLDNVSQLLDVGQRVVRESEARTMNVELQEVTLSSEMVRWMTLLLAHLPHKVMFEMMKCEITPEGEISLDNVSQLLDVGQRVVRESETRTMNIELFGMTLSSMMVSWMTLLLAHLPHKVMFKMINCEITPESDISLDNVSQLLDVGQHAVRERETRTMNIELFGVTLSSMTVRWMTLLLAHLPHKVRFEMMNCAITPEGEISLDNVSQLLDVGQRVVRESETRTMNIDLYELTLSNMMVRWMTLLLAHLPHKVMLDMTNCEITPEGEISLENVSQLLDVGQRVVRESETRTMNVGLQWVTLSSMMVRWMTLLLAHLPHKVRFQMKKSCEISPEGEISLVNVSQLLDVGQSAGREGETRTMNVELQEVTLSSMMVRWMTLLLAHLPHKVMFEVSRCEITPKGEISLDNVSQLLDVGQHAVREGETRTMNVELRKVTLSSMMVRWMTLLLAHLPHKVRFQMKKSCEISPEGEISLVNVSQLLDVGQSAGREGETRTMNVELRKVTLSSMMVRWMTLLLAHLPHKVMFEVRYCEITPEGEISLDNVSQLLDVGQRVVRESEARTMNIDLYELTLSNMMVRWMTLLLAHLPRKVMLDMTNCEITPEGEISLDNVSQLLDVGQRVVRESEARTMNIDLYELTLSNMMVRWMTLLLAHLPHKVMFEMMECEITPEGEISLDNVSQLLDVGQRVVRESETRTMNIDLYELTLSNMMVRWMTLLLAHLPHKVMLDMTNCEITPEGEISLENVSQLLDVGQRVVRESETRTMNVGLQWVTLSSMMVRWMTLLLAHLPHKVRFQMKKSCEISPEGEISLVNVSQLLDVGQSAGREGETRTMNVELRKVTLSSMMVRWMTLLLAHLPHKVRFEMMNCAITPEGEISLDNVSQLLDVGQHAVREGETRTMNVELHVRTLSSAMVRWMTLLLAHLPHKVMYQVSSFEITPEGEISLDNVSQLLDVGQRAVREGETRTMYVLLHARTSSSMMVRWMTLLLAHLPHKVMFNVSLCDITPESEISLENVSQLLDVDQHAVRESETRTMNVGLYSMTLSSMMVRWMTLLLAHLPHEVMFKINGCKISPEGEISFDNVSQLLDVGQHAVRERETRTMNVDLYGMTLSSMTVRWMTLLLAHLPHKVMFEIIHCKITQEGEISLENVSQLLDVGQSAGREGETCTMNVELLDMTLSSTMVSWMTLLLAHLPHKVMFKMMNCVIIPEGEIRLDNVSQLLDVGQHAVRERETRTMNIELHGMTLYSMMVRWMTLLLAHLPHKVRFQMKKSWEISPEGEISLENVSQLLDVGQHAVREGETRTMNIELRDLTWSSMTVRWMTLLLAHLPHKVRFEMMNCAITPEGEISLDNVSQLLDVGQHAVREGETRTMNVELRKVTLYSMTVRWMSLLLAHLPHKVMFKMMNCVIIPEGEIRLDNVSQLLDVGQHAVREGETRTMYVLLHARTSSSMMVRWMTLLLAHLPHKVMFNVSLCDITPESEISLDNVSQLLDVGQHAVREGETRTMNVELHVRTLSSAMVRWMTLLLAHLPHKVMYQVSSFEITPEGEISLDNVSQLLDVGQRAVREGETRTMYVLLHARTSSSMMVRWMTLLLAHLPHKVMFNVSLCDITPESEISLENVSQLLDVGQHAVRESETRTMNVGLYSMTLSSMMVRWMTLLLAHLPHEVMFKINGCKISPEGEISFDNVSQLLDVGQHAVRERETRTMNVDLYGMTLSSMTVRWMTLLLGHLSHKVMFQMTDCEISPEGDISLDNVCQLLEGGQRNESECETRKSTEMFLRNTIPPEGTLQWILKLLAFVPGEVSCEFTESDSGDSSSFTDDVVKKRGRYKIRTFIKDGARIRRYEKQAYSEKESSSATPL